MKKLLLILFLFINLVSNGQFYNNYHYKLPYVSNPTVNVISTTQAIASFSYSGNGCKVSEVYIEWSDDVVQRSTTQTPINSEMVNTSQFIGQMIANSSTCYVFVRVTNCMGYSQSSIIFFSLASQQGSIPTVVTNAATSITQTQATMNGNVTSSGDAAVSDRGFYYGLSNPPTTKASSGSTGTGTFSVGLGGLQSNTQYFFKAYAVNNYGEATGDVLNFTTQAANTAPTVPTAAAYTVTTGSAVTGGNVTNDGGATVTERGVYYGTSPNPSTQYSAGGSGTGNFTVFLGYLAANTTYYYRAYARNSYGTAYGVEYSFTTLATSQLPTVTTTAGSNITAHSFNSGGNVTNQGSSTVTARGIVVSTTANPTLEDRLFQTSDDSGVGVFTSSLGDLTCGTTYHVRAYATNSSGTAYGSDITITTLSEDLSTIALYQSLSDNCGTIIAISQSTAEQLCNQWERTGCGTGSRGAKSYRITSLNVGDHFDEYNICKKTNDSRWGFVYYPYPTKYVINIQNGVIVYKALCN